MPKFFVNEEQIQKEDVKVIGNDVKHIKNVLREKVGNELIICNTSNKKDYLFLQKTIDILAQHSYTVIVPRRERKERFENHT